MGQRGRVRHLVSAVVAAVTGLGLVAAGAGFAAPASAAGALMKNSPKSLGGWGVTGLNTTTSPVSGWKSNVTALAEWNNRIYVGGMFTTVANTGAARAGQPYLAAFDRATGAWVSSFRPRLDGGVWDLKVTSKGQLLVAGYFATVNGATHRGLVALSPTTGAVDSSFRVSLSRTSGRVGVRTLDVQGGWVYLGGNVNTVAGGTGTDVGTVTGKNLFRVKVTNGRPSAAFRPTMSTAPWQVYASRSGDRVYAAGAFGVVNGVQKEILAVLSTTNGALVGGVSNVRPTYDCRPGCASSTYAPSSEAVYETADRARVIATPTEHGLQSFNRTTMSRRYGHYTAAAPGATRSGGGDFQAIAEVNGVIYASCHCWDVNYSGAYTTIVPGKAPTSWTRYSRINGIGAYDSVSLAKLDTFMPDLYGSRGDGTWELLKDSAGCLWAGGDITHASGGRWFGGFAKFCTT